MEPKNEVIVQNNYYPSGLKELTVKAHYQKYKDQILKEVDRKPVIFAIAIKPNQFIIRRNQDNTPIILTSQNYDHFMHGRVISLFAELGYISDLWIVDIDPGTLVSETDSKKALEDVINIFKNLWNQGFSKDKLPRVISTSRGYHVLANMHKRGSPDTNRYELLPFLSPLSDKYIIDKRRSNETEIILDLSPMRRRGSHVVPYALTRNGLMAMDITKTWKKFKRKDAIIPK